MMQKKQAPYPSHDWREWALKLVSHLNEETIQGEVTATPIFLTHYRANDKAVQDGIVMFHPSLGKPIYSYNGVWRTFDGVPI